MMNPKAEFGMKQQMPYDLIGFGQVAPTWVSLSTHSTQQITNITWENWGHMIVRGKGLQQNQAAYPDLPTYKVPAEPVYLVLMLGSCPNGHSAYESLSTSFKSYQAAMHNAEQNLNLCDLSKPMPTSAG